MKLKNILLAFALVFAMVFTGCEEEEEPAQTLTAFIVGEWESQDLMLGDTEAHFLADIEKEHYTLTLVVGDESVELEAKGYTIDEEASTITIEQPTFPGDEPADELIPFDVLWEENGNTMTWLPVDPLEENDVPDLIWARKTGM